MKVGVIVTDSFHDIVGELQDAGIDINVLAIQEGTSLQVNQEIAVFLSGSQGYDLIHVIGSAVPLLYCRFIEAPMLVTIHKEPTEMEQRIYASAPQNCYFIAAPSLGAIEGVNTLGDFEPSQAHPRMYYHELYERIVRMYLREDHRPWGYYEVLSDHEGDHKVKRITVWPKKRLSLQMHNKRKEHWIVISGLARVTLGRDEITLGPSGTIDIPLGTVHRIENIGDEPLVFIEVQQGDYFGEDDIIRLADDFGRT